ncbi:DUF6113 family protein [Agromyces atrinae]|uniref:Amino acid transporter n=1 Tax=Agromyces atrinae TaxID=592376 RepID=A0A4Q2M1G3_9MICO|nr:DUF6113 family protein [Agromyces atrinae]MCI2959245.1 DUF6113 family protein [Agromyces atrinae]NYD65536.1 amino acid transporter [Agromyces atrinae]RXZ85735.1 hypothetical protein ESP50_13125 [Agromyces atrinae]
MEKASLGSRIAVYAVSALAGAVFGFFATFGHQAQTVVAGVSIPWGIVLALLGVAALVLGIRLITRDRWASFWTAGGLLAVVFVLSLPGIGGSVLVTDSVLGTVWAVGPTLIAVLIVAWPTLPNRSRSRA